MARSSVFPTATYSSPEESSFNQDVISAVEKSMKKYADNLMRFLEGISSRLSQLELCCYNLDKSIGEMRSDLVRDHGKSESNLKCLEKHIQEVHRSVQLLRDKQELADTQKELEKLHLSKKESSSTDNTQQNEEKTFPPVSEAKKSENSNSSSEHGQQIVLALPHQITPQPSLPTHHPIQHQQPPMGPQSSVPPQIHAYYMPSPQTPNLPPPSQPYPPLQSQIQDPSRPGPHPTQSQVNPGPQVQSLPPYQQQWAQQPVIQPQILPSAQPVYSYPPNQSPTETAPNSIPMQAPSRIGSAAPEAMSYGYDPSGRLVQPQPPPQHLKTGYGDGYGPRSALAPSNAYMMFDSEGGKAHHPPPQPHFQQNAYPPSGGSLQNLQRVPSANMVVPQSVPGGHPYSELIEKLVAMGYRGDHVVGVIKRLEESGEAIDFNAVLDRLNGQSSGNSQRGWSG